MKATIAAIFLLSCATGVGADEPKAFKPRLADCSIEFVGKSLKPARVSQPWSEDHIAGSARFSITQENHAKLTIFRGAEKLNEQIAPPFHYWSWLASDDRHAYLATARRRASRITDPATLAPTIWKFDLSNGREVAHAPLEPSAPETPRQWTAIMDAMSLKGQPVFLTAAIRQDASASDDDQMFQYKVVCLTPGTLKPRWEKSFKSSGERAQPGALLWAPRRPAYAQSNISGLSAFDDRIVVCAGPLQDILCLDAGSGDVVWKCERVWEFQRGFIGPSVWQHVMHRIGEEPGDSAAKADTETVDRFRKSWSCAIVGGPIAVVNDRPGRDQLSRLFVAVARGPADPFTGFISDCRVFEIDNAGRPIAIIDAPRMIHGAQFAVQNGSLTWACDKNAFIRLVPSAQAAGIGMGAGGFGKFDCLGHVDWYRQFSVTKNGGWFQADPAGDLVTYSLTHAFRTASGGFVQRAGDTQYRFSLEMIELATGTQSELSLLVPFDGVLVPPTSNISRTDSPEGETSFEAYGPHLLWISGMDVLVDTLRIGLAAEEMSWAVEVRLSDLKK